jgi:hypothetical protein
MSAPGFDWFVASVFLAGNAKPQSKTCVSWDKKQLVDFMVAFWNHDSAIFLWPRAGCSKAVCSDITELPQQQHGNPSYFRSACPLLVTAHLVELILELELPQVSVWKQLKEIVLILWFCSRSLQPCSSHVCPQLLWLSIGSTRFSGIICACKTSSGIFLFVSYMGWIIRCISRCACSVTWGTGSSRMLHLCSLILRCCTQRWT